MQTRSEFACALRGSVALYHLHMKVISRGPSRSNKTPKPQGQSILAAAAYRAGERLIDARTGETHDYRRKRGVIHRELLFPAGTTKIESRAKLWSLADQREIRKNSSLGREYEIALPAELNYDQRLSLARNFSNYIVEKFGVAADLCLHAPQRDGDSRNHHAHILTTTRKMEEDGSLGAKTRALDQKNNAEVPAIRATWAEMVNQALANAGHENIKVDHRSFRDQKIDREPQIHVGPVATSMERRSISTDRGDINRGILARNRQRANLTAKISTLKDTLSLLDQDEDMFAWEYLIFELERYLAASIHSRKRYMAMEYSRLTVTEACANLFAVRDNVPSARDFVRASLLTHLRVADPFITLSMIYQFNRYRALILREEAGFKINADELFSAKKIVLGTFDLHTILDSLCVSEGLDASPHSRRRERILYIISSYVEFIFIKDHLEAAHPVEPSPHNPFMVIEDLFLIRDGNQEAAIRARTHLHNYVKLADPIISALLITNFELYQTLKQVPASNGSSDEDSLLFAKEEVMAAVYLHHILAGLCFEARVELTPEAQERWPIIEQVSRVWGLGLYEFEPVIDLTDEGGQLSDDAMVACIEDEEENDDSVTNLPLQG